MMIKLFFPEIRKPTRQEVTTAWRKSILDVWFRDLTCPRQPGEPLIMVDGYQGGSAAKPGPDKNYVKPMGEGYDPGDVDEKLGARQLSLRKTETQLETDSFGKAKAKREKMKKEGFEIEEGYGQKSLVRTLQVV